MAQFGLHSLRSSVENSSRGDTLTQPLQRPSYQEGYKEINPFESGPNYTSIEDQAQAHREWLSQGSSPGVKGLPGGTSASNYTIHEDSREEDVSFNTRSNIFGGVQSPIQRGHGENNLGSEDRAPSSILRGMV